MRYLALLVATNLALIFPLFAQAPDTLWTRTYGDIYSDAGYSVLQTTDGSIIVTGQFGNNLFLMKTDENGDILWLQIYPRWNLGALVGKSVQQTTDCGYIIVGGAFGSGIFLFITDEEGDSVLFNDYGCEFVGGPTGAYSVQQTADEGYIIAGCCNNWPGWSCLKTDSVGNIQWANVFAGYVAYSVIQNLDSDYVIAGRTITKIDINGDSLWAKSYGGSSYSELFSILQTPEGGYFAVGTRSYGVGDKDVLLIKTDEDGDTIWTRTYGGTQDEEGSSICPSSDGNFVISGYTKSFGGGDEDV